MGGVKKERRSISNSDADTVDICEGRSIFEFEPTTILLSVKTFVTVILNGIAGSCYDDCVRGSIVKIQSNVSLR